MLPRAILAAVLGTVAMTLSSTTEMQWRERPASSVPARAALKVLSPVWKPDLKERGMQILGNWTHWLYGAWWGEVFWGLIEVAGLSLVATSVAFFLIVWLAEQIELPLLGLTPLMEMGPPGEPDRRLAPPRLRGGDRHRMGTHRTAA